MSDVTNLVDTRVRLAAFRWFEEQTIIHGDVLSWALLLGGMAFEGVRVPFLSQQGIFKPQALPELPLTIRTSVGGPYSDCFNPDGLLIYAYRGKDPQHRENRGLREAMRRGVPLIYLHGIIEGRYLPVWPVYIVGDDPGALRFTVAADERGVDKLQILSGTAYTASELSERELRRRYATRLIRQRLHQHSFRERVLDAYGQQCALCRLRHTELLDAAHIISDVEEGGEPLVRNGLSLCNLHHRAFDAFFLTVRPDYTVEVRQSILDESDGPMLKHGLQGIHNHRIYTPRAPELRPDRGRLAERLERFRQVG